MPALAYPNDHLLFPLKNLSKDDSIFIDRNKGELSKKYALIMKPIIGKQLAVNVYYQNDLIASANTRINIDLLKIFDEYKINFKVNRSDVTDEERDQAFDSAMVQIIRNKRDFLASITEEEIPLIQKSVKGFIDQTISNNNIAAFKDHFQELKMYLEFANSAITSDRRYIGTAAALKNIVDNEKSVFNLKNNQIGETIEHIIKTSWISLLLADQTGDFQEADFQRLSIICMGHDAGKALMPESIIYKNGRLTQLENDIMKSHVLLSYILSSNNQQELDFENFAMALHHIKEKKDLPQSYSIAPDTHTSFFEYLTSEAQNILNKVYYSTRKFYRVVSIADTFEAITAERVYKKGSSIGKALEIMVKDNTSKNFFYQPYLDCFIAYILQKFLPKNLKFKITDEFLDTYYENGDLNKAEKKFYKKNYVGLVIATCSNLHSNLKTVVYNIHDRKIDKRFEVSPLFFLNNTYFN